MIFDVILTKLHVRWQDEIHEIVVGWFSLTLGSVLSAGGDGDGDEDEEDKNRGWWWGWIGDGESMMRIGEEHWEWFLSSEALLLKDHFDCTGSHVS